MSKRILIVDDSAVVRTALRILLENEVGGAVCSEACNGRDAVNQVSHLKPDLIVLDLSMPVMNGLDAAPQLKSQLPWVPIVMFTGFGGEYMKNLAASAGVSAVVDKSATGELLATVRAFLYGAA